MSTRRVSNQRFALIAVFATLFACAALVAGTAGAQSADGSPGATVGEGTEMIYTNCYEQVAGFRVPLSLIRALVGSELPAGLAYRTFDPAGTIGQLNVVGLSCEQGGRQVTDVLLNAPLSVPGTALRVRTYTDSPETSARYGLFCFGNVTTLADVEATVEVDPSTGARRGHVSASDGVGSIELTTTTSALSSLIAPATLQHLTVKGGELHGRIEWGSSDPGISQPVVAATATLVLDGAQRTGAAGGQHVFAPEGGPAGFFHRGLTSCPPGLDWND
jgi:hypothetical protein